MTSCAYPGCPSIGNHEHNGKLYCEFHLRLTLLDEAPGELRRLPKVDKVNVEGREN